ncbi:MULTISPECIES: GntR family transcriptional regulator [Tepidibacillus]|uniref:GntR family transcriptional regulator n=1 Tax=Tepidibacillus decaturensis TaxID=1413211 RepID=A0A135L6Z1_9BACI|nr:MULTISPECIES: GntR family transcriptional regulator [Tepidibacillus]KXG44740.1 GntR family transcriptional regulator [Tepidibacillus decaturensis]GBF11501.1 HTH-type transcriptional repressor YtrA [Tepidibacillus sp. HK-1]
MFELDVRSRRPIYEQLVDKIKESIISQILKPDEKLPSVRMLSKELTINPNTIQKAYSELERQGYIYSIPGKGNFVAPIDLMPNQQKLKEIKLQLTHLLAEAIYLGLTKKELNEWFDEAKRKTEGGQIDDQSSTSQ